MLKNNTITQSDVGNSVKDYMMEISAYTITSRALPLLEDGFKPSQRRCLYTMHKMGLEKKLAKSAKVEGAVMTYHSHGSQYQTMVRMTDVCESLLLPFIEGKGSFGKHYSRDTEAASSRYTEMKLAPFSTELFRSLAKHDYNMVDNFDGTEKEPLLLSCGVPLILANAQEGIAIGFACNFASFNLNEICDTVISVVRKKKNPYKGLKVPDFPTGGIILYDEEQMNNVFESGRGTVRVRAVFEDCPEERSLNIIEIPYTTSAEVILASVYKNYDKGIFPEITSITDQINADGFKISIEYKRGTDVELLKSKLYYYTPCEDSFTFNQTLLYNNRPYTMGVKEIIDRWLEHRITWVNNEIIYDIGVKEARAHILEGLKAILIDIDKAVKLVRESKNDTVVIANLMKGFSIDEAQAQFVANIRLRNLNKDYILNQTKELKELYKEIKELKNTDPCDVICNDLERIKKEYGIPRKTKIVTSWEEFTPAKEPKVQEEDSIIFLGDLDCKKLQSDSRAKTPAGYTKYETKPTDSILLFTSLGKVFKVPVSKLSKGTQLPYDGGVVSHKDLEMGENILCSCLLTKKTKKDKVIFIAYDKKIAVIDINSFDLSRKCIAKGILPNALFVQCVDKKGTVFYNGENHVIKDYPIIGNRLSKGINPRPSKK